MGAGEEEAAEYDMGPGQPQTLTSEQTVGFQRTRSNRGTRTRGRDGRQYVHNMTSKKYFSEVRLPSNF